MNKYLLSLFSLLVFMQTTQAIRENVLPLFQAVSRGQIDKVKSLIDQGYDVNSKGPYEKTALYDAALFGHLELAKLLISKGANVDLTDDRSGVTPLHTATSEGHQKIAKVLIENKANIHAKTIDGHTPLYLAVQYGHTNIFKLLMEAGAGSKAALEDALIVASQGGHAPIVQLILKRKGVNVNYKNKNGETPLYLAASEGHTNIFKLLMEAGAGSKAALGDALVVASARERTPIIRLILKKKGVSINYKDVHGKTPLIGASRLGTPKH